VSISRDLIGRQAGPRSSVAETRWLLSFAAGLGDTKPVHLDTTVSGGLKAHPLFPVCLEWPVILDLGRDLAAEDLGSAVAIIHASHDTVLLQPIGRDELLTTTLTVVGLEAKKPGVLVTLLLESRNAQGDLVSSTQQGNFYLGETLDGPDAAPPARDEIDTRPPSTWSGSAEMVFTAGEAHLYTEAARIYNPIHTDRAVALAAGLPGLLLHGTSTMGHAVTAVVDQCADGDPTRVQRIMGRFSGMVSLPSRAMVHWGEPETWGDGLVVRYVVESSSGQRVIDRGVVVLSCDSGP